MKKTDKIAKDEREKKTIGYKNVTEQSLIQEIKEKIEVIKSDERLTYKPATVFANAPLALIQATRMARLNELENLLGLPLSTLPLPKKDEQDS